MKPNGTGPNTVGNLLQRLRHLNKDTTMTHDVQDEQEVNTEFFPDGIVLDQKVNENIIAYIMIDLDGVIDITATSSYLWERLPYWVTG